MQARQRLARVQILLVAAALLHAMLWGVAVVTLLYALVLVASYLFGWSLEAQTLKAFLTIAGVATFGSLLWRNRALRSIGQVALWLEERVAGLRYALVTLLEPGRNDARLALEGHVAETAWGHPVRGVLMSSARVPLLILAGGLAVLLLLPARAVNAGILTKDRSSQSNTGETGDPFRDIAVTVSPPAYSGRKIIRLRNPEAVTTLVGSTIRIEGTGWQEATTMRDTATPFWLEQEGHRHLILLIPIPDSVPEVQLLLPVRDSVLRSPEGAIRLSSVARDDIGLNQAWFEYIVSSGEGENYTFRSGVVGSRVVSNSLRTELAARLPMDSLKLAPGNIVHLRAVARDGNDVTGPGIGYSETRTLRVPRPGEGDSIMVDQVAPAQGDSSLLSQRMLILLAEALERKRARIRRDSLIVESRRIAADQASLRRRVADIIFLRLGGEGSMEESADTTAQPLTPEELLSAAEQATAGSTGEMLDFSEDETPVVALNRPLLEAYNAMWAAGRELEIGEPRRALPHMREALEAIQRARQAERIYLRGRPAVSVVDIARVRLAGTLADADPVPTAPGSPSQKTGEALLARYVRALALLPDASAADSLQLLRIDALDGEPEFAAILGEVVAAIRAGRDATGPLIRARRLLAGNLEASAGLRAWDIIP